MIIEQKRLYEVAIITDSLHQTPAYVSDGIPMVRVTDVKPGYLSLNQCFKVSEDDYVKFTTNHIPQRGDIIISRVGSYGNFSFVSSDERFCLGQNTAIISPLINPEYLYYYLSSALAKAQIESVVVGSTQKTISLKSIKELSIPVFDNSTQDRIASILGDIDRKINCNIAINQNLLQQGLTLFSSWFVDYVPFNGKEPENWKSLSVYDLAEFINGAAFKQEEYAENGMPIIKISELKNGITDSTQYCCVTKDSKYYIDDHDILFSWSGNPDTSIDTFVWSAGKAILNQHTFRVVSKYNAPAFMYYLLKYLKPQFTHIASNKQTTGLGHVTVADLKRLQFRGNEDAITEFNKVVTPIYDLMFLNLKEIQILSSIRDSLLPKLMSGEIDVSEIEL